MQENNIRAIGRAIFTIFIVLSLTGCFLNDGGEYESRAWVRIDSPIDGFSTGEEYVTVKGNAALGEASYAPEAIYWYNNGSSGVLPHQTICICSKETVKEFVERMKMVKIPQNNCTVSKVLLPL